MKKLIFILLLLSTTLFAKLTVGVSILPEKTFVEAIGGEKIRTVLMVLPGNSPHTYEPKPSQMREIATATLYFAIGVEFESAWLPKFKSLNTEMEIVDLSEEIVKQPIVAHHHHDKNERERETLDPHIWVSPANVKIIATKIFETLKTKDPINEAYYQKNFDAFLKTIEQTDFDIKTLFAHLAPNTPFMVFHPAWGYFASRYGLVQMAVEIEGKSPKPKEIITLIKEAKAKKVSAIFTQPEFSDASAKIIAIELGIPVVKISPLEANWRENLLRFAHAIAGK